MNDIFTRVDSVTALPQVLEQIAVAYGLGAIATSSPILTGYQDCNIDLSAANGRFIIKIFASDKTKERIDDVITGYTTLRKNGVPVPVIKTTLDGRTLWETPGNQHTSYACVFEYFEGKPFTKTQPTDHDIASLTTMLANIHNTKHLTPHYYDTMGIVNLPGEYKLKSGALSAEELSKISPVVSQFQRIPVATFPKTLIHGTPEKENVLKNANGELCLLDLGCMDYNAAILDIATLIANFALYVTEEKRKQFIHLILDTYNNTRQITPAERAALPSLIRAQYAAYVIAMTYHMRKNHDMTKQTQVWLDRGWDGLKAFTHVRKLV
ncbi:phosphotransferase [Patescibacteria group bacterium]|nr:phosphotransferase [Patescibacteria group bacterium]